MELEQSKEEKQPIAKTPPPHVENLNCFYKEMNYCFNHFLCGFFIGGGLALLKKNYDNFDETVLKEKFYIKILSAAVASNLIYNAFFKEKPEEDKNLENTNSTSC